jgi:ASC-1-like (ASCH) protein
MEIKKKIWPEYFEKILQGEKNAELRLADFEINEGDILILEEYNPKTKTYTGRKINKKVKYINKSNPTEAYSLEEIKKFGFYLIELE